MLPEVTLQNVSRDDVDRVAWWLEDRELSSMWFGHYGCGDPMHRGYEPRHMIEASQWEWDRVFGDSDRVIFSIYTQQREHVGECQMVMQADGGAELSVLIGVKDLWHRGYGTSTVMKLLDRVFGEYGVDRAWVNVPEDNTPALGLFEKLGFVREATRELCKRPDGSPLNATILTIASPLRRELWRESPPVVTLTGLPGSGSEAIGAEVARITGSRYMDAEISERLSRRLRCSHGELESLEGNYRSVWLRLLRAIVIPMEWSAAYDVGYSYFRPERKPDADILEEHVTKRGYLEGLAAVIRRIAMERDVVLLGHGAHLYVPSNVGALNVFVTGSFEFRQRQLAVERGLSADEAQQWLQRRDRDVVSIFKHLHGADLMDMGQYDLTVNVDRLTPQAAAQMVVGVLHTAARGAVPVAGTMPYSMAPPG